LITNRSRVTFQQHRYCGVLLHRKTCKKCSEFKTTFAFTRSEYVKFLVEALLIKNLIENNTSKNCSVLLLE